VSITLEDDGERIIGRAPGVSKKELLERAREQPDEEIDLHRMTGAAAEAILKSRLGAAHHAGKRSVLIIHGRGLHSAGGEGVLRDVVVATLQAPSVRGCIHGFITARKEHGGAGALHVFLRAPNR
jgi:DNA-nicking Smr family endonuclease